MHLDRHHWLLGLRHSALTLTGAASRQRCVLILHRPPTKQDSLNVAQGRRFCPDLGVGSFALTACPLQLRVPIVGVGCQVPCPIVFSCVALSYYYLTCTPLLHARRSSSRVNIRFFLAPRSSAAAWAIFPRGVTASAIDWTATPSSFTYEFALNSGPLQ